MDEERKRVGQGRRETYMEKKHFYGISLTNTWTRMHCRGRRERCAQPQVPV
jgi:hypothetical protein